MTVLKYIRDFLPKLFNVNPAFGKIAEMVYYKEVAGEEQFSNESFDNPRYRAALAIPYQVKDIKERERVLNVLEIILLRHRVEFHGEDWWVERIIELKENTTLLPQEADLLTKLEESPRSFWSG